VIRLVKNSLIYQKMKRLYLNIVDRHRFSYKFDWSAGKKLKYAALIFFGLIYSLIHYIH